MSINELIHADTKRNEVDDARTHLNEVKKSSLQNDISQGINDISTANHAQSVQVDISPVWQKASGTN